jgi:protein-S-isoprenylcysteine O-methyltransferase Ste14
VRHPGYTFDFAFFLGISLAPGSLWALIPAVMLCPPLVARTVLEDRTLHNELPGYEEYAQRD